MIIVNIIHHGDCLSVLKTLENESVNCVITSPPYFGLRDYGVEGQIGLEETPEAYAAKLVAVFGECKRVLANDGTLWLNLGDSYATGHDHGATDEAKGWKSGSLCGNRQKNHGRANGGDIPSKNILGIPWRVAFALQADGWYLRQDIIWQKPNPMPESVTDRCTKSHEYIFLLSKNERYYFDNEAIKTSVKQDWGTRDRTNGKYHNEGSGLAPHGGLEKSYEKANKRSVWTVNTKPFKMNLKISRLSRVAPDAISDDMRHIVFPSCQDCEGLIGSVSNGLYDECGDELLNRILHIDSHLSKEQFYGFSQFLTPLAKDYDERSSGYSLHKYFLFANDHNNENRKKVLELLTKIPYKVFFQIIEGIGDTLDALFLSVLYLGIHGSSISLDGMDARLLDKIPNRIVDKFSCSYCQFYRIITESQSHFATYPEELIEPMVLAGTKEDGIVLDPFFGSGTTGLVAKKLKRNYIGIELNEKYIAIAEKRINSIPNPIF